MWQVRKEESSYLRNTMKRRLTWSFRAWMLFLRRMLNVWSELSRNFMRSWVRGGIILVSNQSDFTEGSILKKLVAFMFPVLGALILQAAYGAVDLLVVGRFGSTSGLSAVSTGSQVLNLVTFVVIQLAMGIPVLIARYLGEKRPEQIGSVIGGSAIPFELNF